MWCAHKIRRCKKKYYVYSYVLPPSSHWPTKHHRCLRSVREHFLNQNVIGSRHPFFASTIFEQGGGQSYWGATETWSELQGNKKKRPGKQWLHNSYEKRTQTFTRYPSIIARKINRKHMISRARWILGLPRNLTSFRIIASESVCSAVKIFGEKKVFYVQ